MKPMKKIFLATLLTLGFVSTPVFAQRAIIAGEASPGVYENLKSTSQALHVNVTGAVAPVTSITLTTTTPEVTNASTTILAANTARKSMIIQNNHATGIVYVNFTTTATTAHLAIQPGQSLFLQGLVPATAVRAIGSVASNTAVVVLEGQ